MPPIKRESRFPTYTRIGARKIVGLLSGSFAIVMLWLVGAEVPMLVIGILIIISTLFVSLVQFDILRSQRASEKAARRNLANLNVTARAQPRTLSPIPDGKFDSTGISGVKSSTTRLWAGFTEISLSQLKSYALDSSVSTTARGIAYMELARWYATHGQFDDAYIQILRSRAVQPSLPPTPDSDRAAVEVDVLLERGETKEARFLLSRYTSWKGSDSDVLLRHANATQIDGDAVRLKYINRTYHRAGIEPILLPENGTLSLEQIITGAVDPVTNGPLVSVIMPAYNSSDSIAYAIKSVLNQTWRNLELIVVDDASHDGTVKIVEEFMRSDDRIQLLERPTNAGAYAARNLGLQHARGEYITVSDADDWSHPQKIQTQIAVMLRRPSAMASMAHRVRVTRDLIFCPPTGRPREARLTRDFSSLLVRKKAFSEIGPWDEIRGSADSEFRSRLVAFYGENSLELVYPDVPLSLSLLHATSLTGSSQTGMLSLHQSAGARRLYLDVSSAWHASSAFKSDLPFDPSDRPFPAPQMLMQDDRNRRKHFDVVILSSFALPGGTTSSNVEEIYAHQQAGLTTGLFHHPVADWNIRRPINPKVTDALDERFTTFLSVGDEVTCDLLIIRLPKIAEKFLDEMPRIKPRRTIAVINQTPNKTYDGERHSAFDLDVCIPNVAQRFGPAVRWYPIGPLVRSAVETYHAHQIQRPLLSSRDWVNIIDAKKWRRAERRSKDGIIRIGRHSRDVDLKWPDSHVLPKVYPPSQLFEIHVLGGAETPRKSLGGLPDNWVVHEFGSMPAHHFLRGLDLYVYFAHSGLIEAFGRGLLEALAVGVPVITTDDFAPLLGDAAVYSDAEGVANLALSLMEDDEFYAQQVERGYRLVEERFSYSAHIRRVEALRSVNV